MQKHLIVEIKLLQIYPDLDSDKASKHQDPLWWFQLAPEILWI